MQRAKRRNITSASDGRQKVYLASRSTEPNLLDVMNDDLKAVLNENQVWLFRPPKLDFRVPIMLCKTSLPVFVFWQRAFVKVCSLYHLAQTQAALTNARQFMIYCYDFITSSRRSRRSICRSSSSSGVKCLPMAICGTKMENNPQIGRPGSVLPGTKGHRLSKSAEAIAGMIV